MKILYPPLAHHRHTDGSVQDANDALDDADAKRIGDEIEAEVAPSLVDFVVGEWVDESLTSIPGEQKQHYFVRDQKAPSTVISRLVA